MSKDRTCEAMTHGPENNKKLPFLRSLLWQGDRERSLGDQDMLDLYERGWRFLDVLAKTTIEEITYIRDLAAAHGSWLEVECEKLLSTRAKSTRKIKDIAGHDASHLMALLSALRGEFMLVHGIGLSGSTSLFASIIDFDVPDEVSLTLVNSHENIRPFRELIFSEGPLVLFDQNRSKPFVIGKFYFDQCGMWVSVRPKMGARAVKLAVYYEARVKEVGFGKYKTNLTRELPAVSPEDELFLKLVEAAEGGLLSKSSNCQCELIVFFSGLVEELETVTEKAINYGVSPAELKGTLTHVFNFSQSPKTSGMLFSKGKSRLRDLIGDL